MVNIFVDFILGHVIRVLGILNELPHEFSPKKINSIKWICYFKQTLIEVCCSIFVTYLSSQSQSQSPSESQLSPLHACLECLHGWFGTTYLEEDNQQCLTWVQITDLMMPTSKYPSNTLFDILVSQVSPRLFTDCYNAIHHNCHLKCIALIFDTLNCILTQSTLLLEKESNDNILLSTLSLLGSFYNSFQMSATNHISNSILQILTQINPTHPEIMLDFNSSCIPFNDVRNLVHSVVNCFNQSKFCCDGIVNDNRTACDACVSPSQQVLLSFSELVVQLVDKYLVRYMILVNLYLNYNHVCIVYLVGVISS